MGYESQHHQTWSELVQQGGGSVAGVDAVDNHNEKMEDSSTTATLPTFTTGAGDLLEEDDTTTIRSSDSIVGGRALLTLTGELDDLIGAPAIPSSLLGPMPHSSMETCSVSTAPTDEASSLGGIGDWATSLRLAAHHRRVPSWEASPHSQHSINNTAASPGSLYLPPPSPQWGAQHQQPQQPQQVASFRSNVPNPATPPRYRNDSTALPFLPRPAQLEVSRVNNGASYHHHQRGAGGNPYPYHVQRRPFGGLPPAAMTPPRPVSQRPRPLTPGGARSSCEVLKTLLRKKACLYEADTSRAVALVTWLVGRQLALEGGFFSRQDLQAGVHTCVADIMEAGCITRTKVNRCMQIILNSCFHYIIPRPDGSEESGERMRQVFAREMQNEDHLLSSLPQPWNTVSLQQNIKKRVDTTTLSSPTPQSSPKVGSVPASPGSMEGGDSGSDSKRAVLLCFNENVRSAEDVFRCHNEFIRDTAHACHLQLSSQEWKIFFGAQAWGNIGIPVPEHNTHDATDALGLWSPQELARFRTTWCCKRYDHDHELCGFAHPEVNKGWLRRDMTEYAYKSEMCPHVTTATVDYGQGPKKIVLNECPSGRDCDFCHSVEELVYHPTRYKQRVCGSIHRHGASCPLGEVCPDCHPIDSYRFPRKTDGRSPRRGAGHANPPMSSNTKGTSLPNGSPILYAGPAPISSFEQHLQMPGLQSLFRRNSAVVRDLILRKTTTQHLYSTFGDDIVGGVHPEPTNNIVIRKCNTGSHRALHC